MLTLPWQQNIYNLLFHQDLDDGPFLRLCTADPGLSGTISDEVTGGGYHSVSVYERLIYDYSAGTATNDRPIYFVDLPAVTVTHWALCQVGSGTTTGDVIVTDAFAAPLVVPAGKTLVVNPSAITIAIT
jgi:hypothetical protein